MGRSPKRGRKVAAQVAAVVGDGRSLALHDVLEVRDVGVARLADGAPPSLGDGRSVHEPAQLAFGLGAGHVVGVAGRSL
jgi:hypothetical protein